MFFLLIFEITICQYIEIETLTSPTDYHKKLTLERDSGKYYWFEKSQRFFLLYFDQSELLHENPFVLLMVIPGAKKENWVNIENYDLFLNAFNTFKNTSVFLSLLQNDNNANYYKHFIRIDSEDINIEVYLKGHKIFMKPCFEGGELIKYNSLLKQVKISTRSWSLFYDVKNTVQGFFVRVYYITYPKNIKNPNDGFLFRIGNVVDLSSITFLTGVVEEKLYLTKLERDHEVNLISNSRENGKEQWLFQMVYLGWLGHLLFALEKNDDN